MILFHHMILKNSFPNFKSFKVLCKTVKPVLQRNRDYGRLMHSDALGPPKEAKDSLLKSWSKYWKVLYKDYREVAVDVYKDCITYPKKASMYSLIAGTICYFALHNPDESVFQEELVNSSLKLMQLGEPIRNQLSVSYVKWLQQCFNEGTLRCTSLGIFSIIWVHNYDKNSSFYKATCSYLQPGYLDFHKRIVDVGFLDHWWVLSHSMEDYDVNESEFLSTE